MVFVLITGIALLFIIFDALHKRIFNNHKI